MKHLFRLSVIAFLVALSVPLAHSQRPASPRGEAATQIGEAWIVVDYGRPILRGRHGIFGEGEDYGATVTGPAPVWRAGANKSTRLHSEVDLVIGDTEVTAGEYSLFVDLTDGNWTLIVSAHEAKNSGREAGDGLWGSYNYTPDKDVVRVEMTVIEDERAMDQFTIGFVDVTDSGGSLFMAWDQTVASVPFEVAH